MGVAETDPSADLDGWDAAVKVAALAIVLMNAPVRLEQVRRTGIRELGERKNRSVRASGMRYKLVCRAERRGDGVDCSVQPELLLASDPLASLKAQAPRSASTSMSSDYLSLSTTPESRPPGTACSRISFAPFAVSRMIAAGWAASNRATYRL